MERHLSKNILIFSDGTGQRSGLSFDESRSNIYKLYRATRCGPDSCINPTEQLAYYDPGIGTVPGGLGFFGAIVRWIHNKVSQATGLGLTHNISDCYSAILQLWEPGDRIFLFGFSRGAYTVRCLAAVLALCGVPTRMKDGKPFKRDAASTRKIAKEAVKGIYQHVSSPQDSGYVPQRDALGRRFRAQYASGDAEKSNAYPHFIGVFDTVAALANYDSLAVIAVALLVIISAASAALWFFFSSFWFWFAIILGATACITLIAYAVTHIKVAFGLEGFPWWKTLHFTAAKMKFYDRRLNTNVGWARHALSVDEHRADFDRVAWGGKTQQWRATKPGEPEWLEQWWFAGNHADIGGGYPENESRLSDIALDWMVGEAQQVPDGIKVDRSVLRLFPSSQGMQHDECRSLAFRYAGRLTRTIESDAMLHDSIFERFKLPSVLQYDEMKPYRPIGLREHHKLAQYYTPNGQNG